MSLVPDGDQSFWINCPPDILILIFERLDINSLINCMHVNKTWSDTVYYYCQHYKLWGKMLEKSIHKKALTFEEKSELNEQDLFFNAHDWLNIDNSTVLPCYKYIAEKIRKMCVFKGMLIVTTHVAFNFFDIRGKNLKKRFDKMCLDYVETASLIAQFTLSNFEVIGYNILTLSNKLHNNVCECNDVDNIILFDISVYKVYLNSCYVVDIRNVLWVYKADECIWNANVLARYYGNKESINTIHIHGDDVYMLIKSGDIYKVDRQCMKFERLFTLDIPHYYLRRELFMFHKYSVLFAVPRDKKQNIYPTKGRKQIIVACPGLTCVLEHGPVLIAGYENGTVKIFVIDKLLNNDITPALQFELQTYVSLQSYGIIAIDVYEANDGHHLFLATENDICELLIRS